jgi:site-specific DNA-cytosine methylase
MKINPWVPANRPCVTLTKTFSDFQLKISSGIRNLTIAEATRIASFPDAFQWTDAKHGRERIGNSVPPLFMYHIASHIYHHILALLPESEGVYA